MDKNLDTYNSQSVVTWYDHLTGITPAEQAVFDAYKHLLPGAELLDIGIGGGRTTAFLVGRCKKYTGIDYSQGFAALVKQKYPGETIVHMDARDLSAFETGSFGFVNFSFNGMDYVDLPGREKILSEIYRVLKPGGIFFFSTHNRNHASFDVWPWKDKQITTWIKLKTFIKLIPYLYRKTRNKKHEIKNRDYAIINDSAHNYSLMTFYTSPLFLRKQLESAGFKGIKLHARTGKDTADEHLDDWIFATATKDRT